MSKQNECQEPDELEAKLILLSDSAAEDWIKRVSDPDELRKIEAEMDQLNRVAAQIAREATGNYGVTGQYAHKRYRRLF